MYIGQRCWHDFVVKGAPVKNVTVNVTDRDKINIVSSQAVIAVSLKTPHSEFQAILQVF